ncbi:transcriptional protein SWT1 [Diabrotica virgifera virgifera]|uniref:Transcriptional protein SWT1-like n=1 Tax=Diabrotica virgifera virgifera TaxID=50390 RepID=A0A6P7GSI2_DIAVI|nr:transcriptional protein SWT1 [Diabrotica virgifera virgifera]
MSNSNKRSTLMLDLSNEYYEDSYDDLFQERFSSQPQRKKSFDAEQTNHSSQPNRNSSGLMHPPSSTTNLANNRLSRLRHSLQKDLEVKQLTPSPPAKKIYDPVTSKDPPQLSDPLYIQSRNAGPKERSFGSYNSSPTSSMSPLGKKYVSPLLRDDISYKRRSNDASDEVPNKKMLLEPMVIGKVKEPSSSISSVSKVSQNEKPQISRRIIKLSRHTVQNNASKAKESSSIPRKTLISQTQNTADSFKPNRIHRTSDNQIATNKTRIYHEEIPTDQKLYDLKTRDLPPTLDISVKSSSCIADVKESYPKRRIIKSRSIKDSYSSTHDRLDVAHKSLSGVNSSNILTKSDRIPSIDSFQLQQSCESVNSSRDGSIDSKRSTNLNSPSEKSEISRQNTNRLKRTGEALSNAVYTSVQNRLHKSQKITFDDCNDDLNKPLNNSQPSRKVFKLPKLGNKGAKTSPDALLNSDVEDPNKEKQKKTELTKNETNSAGSRSTIVSQLSQKETKRIEEIRSIFFDQNKDQINPTESRSTSFDVIVKDEPKSIESSPNKHETKVTTPLQTFSVQSRLTRIKQSPSSSSNKDVNTNSVLSGIYEKESGSNGYSLNTGNRLNKQQEPNVQNRDLPPNDARNKLGKRQEPNFQNRELSPSKRKMDSAKATSPNVKNFKVNINTLKNSRTISTTSKVQKQFSSPPKQAQSVFDRIGHAKTSPLNVQVRLKRTACNIDTENDQGFNKNNAFTEEPVNCVPAEKTQFITSWIKRHHNLPVEEIDSGLGQLDDSPDDMEWSNAEAETEVLDPQALDIDMDLPMGSEAKSLKSVSVSEAEDNKNEITKEKEPFLCIVVDTNVFISDLMKVWDIIELKVSGSIKPLIYIPWIVIIEIDDMKDRTGDNSLKNRALNASKCINDLLEAKEPRVKGQTVSEMCDQEHIGLSQDDKIIGACLQAVDKYEMVMLLSNDINLRNKAMINGIPAVSANGIIMKIMSKIARDSKYPVIMQKLGILCSTIICELVQEAYGHVWMQMDMLAHPPWSFIECLKRFKKYWTAVFKGKLMKQFIKTVDKLLELFKFNKDFCDDSDAYQDFVRFSLDLCVFLQDLNDFRLSVKKVINEITKIQ